MIAEESALVEATRQQMAEWDAIQPLPGTCCIKLFRNGLRVSKFCGRRVIDGTPHCYWHYPKDDKYKRELIESYFGPDVTLGAALEKEVRQNSFLDFAYLRKANLGGDFLTAGPDLTGIRLIGADLRECSFSYSNLSGAQLAMADLRRAKLSECLLEKTNFFHASLFETKFRDSDLSKAVHLRKSNFRSVTSKIFLRYRMLEQYPAQAGPMYLELSRYFSNQGLYDDASWAAYKGSLMRHKVLASRAKWSNFRTRLAMRSLFTVPVTFEPEESNSISDWIINVRAWCSSFLILAVTGFGEKPMRVVSTSLCVILLYTIVYMLPSSTTAHSFTDSLYFSVVTFTTLGYGDIVPHGSFRLVAGTEALCGILLTGLFLFCFGRRSTNRS